MEKIEYKVVRSYGPNSTSQTILLDKAFEEGYQFVRASEYIEGEDDKAGYIEYILCKEVKECI